MPTRKRPNTKARLLEAGIREFGAHGYRGASLRDIAKRADTNVAAVRYHYNSKEELWRAVVSHLYSQLADAILDGGDRIPGTSTRETIRNSTRNYILFSAKNPELYRITMFEMIDGGKRLEWLAQYQLRQFMERSMAWASIGQQGGVFSKEIAPLNLVYATMGAVQTIFVMAPQVERSFGVDVFEEKQIDAHVNAILQLFGL